MSTSVAELLAEFVSVTPSGAATTAVLDNVPVEPAAITAVTVNVTDAPTDRLTVALIAPLPEAGHVPPPLPAHVHVIDVTPAGIASVTDAPVAVEGPRLVATIV